MRQLTLTIFLLITASITLAQNGEIRGFVYDKDNGEPIMFTNVYFEGTTFGNATDLDGLYTITKVPPGKYTLISTYLGYDTFRTSITIKSGELLNYNIYLNPSSIKLKEIKISDKKVTRQTTVKVSKIRISPTDIEKLPAIGATPDLAQYIQILPGVVTSGDKGGQIYIRGGTPVMNKVIIDGMTIYNPFHSIGLFSVFDIDMVKSIDLYAGGFNAEYGDRISAVMDIRSKDGNKKRLDGKIGVSPFVSKLLISGPLKKFEENSGSSSFLFSARNSYLNKTGPVLYNYADSNGLPYSFNDFYGKLSFNSAEGSKIHFFGFSFNDKVNFEDITQYKWNAAGFGTQFLLVPEASSTIIDGRFSYSNYHIEQQEADNLPRYSAIRGFEAGMKFSYYIGKDLVKYGFELSGLQNNNEFYSAANRKIGGKDEPISTTNIAGFVRYKKIIGPLIIEPSLRLQHYGKDLQETVIEPRLGGKLNINEWFRLKFAGGYYSQSILSTFSDRDVVNYFYGFLVDPISPVYDDFEKEISGTSLQKAQHLIFGTEVDIKDHSLLNIEFYMKNFNNLININRNKIFDNTSEFENEPGYLRYNFITEKGLAQGLNVHYIFEKKPFYLWVVYDLAFVDRKYINPDGEVATYTPNWDRRHNVQFLGTVTFGNKNPWDLSLRWNFGSSLPFTQTQGFYEYLNFAGGIDDDYINDNGQLQVLYADELNGGRLPHYHRLDISAKKTFNFSRYRKLEINLSLVNVYNRNNIFYYDRFKNTIVYQLPLLPSLGLTYSF